MKSALFLATVPETLSGFLFPFADHFRSLGWRVDGMAQGINKFPECQQRFDRVWDVEWSRNPLDPKNILVAAPRIQEIVTAENYDIVHVHTPVAAFVTRFALRNRQKQQELSNTSVIYTAHGFHFYQGGNKLKNIVFFALEKLAGQWTDYLITINQEDENAAKKYHLVPENRVYYTPGIGVDTSLYNSSNVTTQEIEAVRQELGLKQEDVLFLCIAEFISRKRHRDILQALKKLNNSHVHIAFAGDGILQEAMVNLSQELGLQNQVHFLGFRSDIPVLIHTSLAVLLTSEQEGLPRSIMEALCLETPVIGTDIRGTRDLLDEGCGLLVKVGDINGLALAMAWLLHHPQEVIAMGKRGKQKMAAYDIENIIKFYENIYRQAMGNEPFTVCSSGLEEDQTIPPQNNVSQFTRHNCNT